MRRRPCLLAALCLAALLCGCARLSPEREQVLSAASAHLGKPYQPGGTGAPGFDCSGLVATAYGRVGLTLPRSVAEQATACAPVETHRLRPGDLVFFGRGERATHSGIYLGRGRFIHASTSQGVRVSELEAGYWGERFLFGCDCLGD